MPEIGATLREARQRRRIDVFDVESQTKIRAKYLRALEEEEWDLLPGPTYVKTFLRTYAEFLGLDAKLLVEEYKQRFERPSTMELTPFARGPGPRRERRRSRALLGPALAVVLVLVLVLGALYALGSWGDDGSGGGETSAETPTATPAKKAKKRKKPAAPTRVTLQIVPTGIVNVCLVDAAGKTLINNQDLQAGNNSKRYRGKRFRVSFGNGQVRLKAGKRTIEVPDRSTPVGYDVRPGKRPRELPESRRPTCT
jgi:cytoskeleton protein RodZ